MTPTTFTASLTAATPPPNLPAPLEALWWDAHGDWARAHALVDELETPDAMAVHAYLHRKEGSLSNADYWYRLAGSAHQRPTLDAEWTPGRTPLDTPRIMKPRQRRSRGMAGLPSSWFGLLNWGSTHLKGLRNHISLRYRAEELCIFKIYLRRYAHT